MKYVNDFLGRETYIQDFIVYPTRYSSFLDMNVGQIVDIKENKMGDDYLLVRKFSSGLMDGTIVPGKIVKITRIDRIVNLDAAYMLSKKINKL
jgi:hypothetical protein